MRRSIAVVLSMILSLSSATAFGDPSAADKETARALMAEGRGKRDKGDHRGALAFRAAHKIMGVPTTGLEVGRTEAELGFLIEARDTLLAVTRIAVKPGEPEPFAKAREEAEKLADAIAPRIPSVKLIGKSLPAGARVTIDGVDVTSSIGVPRKVNPGEHSVVVTSDGREKATKVMAAESENKEIEIDFIDSVARDGEGSEPPTRNVSPLAVTGFVIAGVGLVAGGITGVMHMSKTSSLKERCAGGRCGPETHDDYDSARTLGTLSTISFAVAGAGAVVGIIGLMTGKPRTETTTAGVHVYVTGTGLAVAGAF